MIEIETIVVRVMLIMIVMAKVIMIMVVINGVDGGCYSGSDSDTIVIAIWIVLATHGLSVICLEIDRVQVCCEKYIWRGTAQGPPLRTFASTFIILQRVSFLIFMHFYITLVFHVIENVIYVVGVTELVIHR